MVQVQYSTEQEQYWTVLYHCKLQYLYFAGAALCTSEMQGVDEDDVRVGAESAGGEELRQHFVRAITDQLVDCPTSCLDVVFEVHRTHLSRIIIA